MKRTAALKPRTPLARSSVPLRRAPLVQKRIKPKLAVQQRARLADRSHGWCEIRWPNVCTGQATDAAHRIGEGSGGRHGAAAELNDRLSGVLHACRSCHQHCHANPAFARGKGWMLRNGDRPAAEPVYYAGRGWRKLDDDGGVS